MLKRDEVPEDQEEQGQKAQKLNGNVEPRASQTSHAEESDEDEKIVEI
jgi:hypothetical protein